MKPVNMNVLLRMLYMCRTSSFLVFNHLDTICWRVWSVTLFITYFASSVTSSHLYPSILLSMLFRNNFSHFFSLTWSTKFYNITRHRKLDVLTVTLNFCFLQCISLTCILKVNWLEIKYCLSKHLWGYVIHWVDILRMKSPMCSTGSPVWRF
jgi:hypothetical protein